METLVTIVHYFVCFFMIIIILLQAGKGADIGAAFGAGGSQTIFGPRGAATFLNKMTAVVAALFVCTSLTLVAMSRSKSAHSILEKVPAPAGETLPIAPPPVEPLTTPEKQK